mgnify:CR=1 FL=1|jgi:hypothetical protein
MERQMATTAEQSARLLKCGVPAESADMCWFRAWGNVGDFNLNVKPYSMMVRINEESCRGRNEIQPAWSLSALLGLMPFKIHSGKYEYWLDVAPMDYGKQWSIGYYCTEKPRVIKGLTHTDSLIECAVQEIEWLTANGYKLNGIEKGGEV